MAPDQARGGRGASRLLAVWLALLVLLTTAQLAQAHPMPNAVVTLTPQPAKVEIEVDTPAPDLEIAVWAEPGRTQPGAAPLAPTEVGAYFLRHVALADSAGRRLPLAVNGAARIDAADPAGGRYGEWRLKLAADRAGAAPGPYSLLYDAVLHQMPDQVALVRVVAPGRPSRQVGVIRYDLASGAVPPLTVDLASGTLASGFTAMIAVGFLHVLSGLDHILFLSALLMVAPFEVRDGRWRFAGMDRRALRRFAVISAAFTLGHSASLAAGTFGFDAVPVRLTEVLVALSIVVAAVHALRPLFPRREWLVAGGFGLIHGLAFSQTLAALDLALPAKIGALFGFNLGVELAQLAVMALAFPLLAVSGAKTLARPRQAALVLVAAVALLWVGQRAFGLPLPAWLSI